MFFNNLDVANCPIIACTLYDSGSCSSGTFSGSAAITVESSGSFDVKASKTIEAGYQWDACVVCTNGAEADQQEMDSWTIAQVKDCTTSLIEYSGDLTDINVQNVYTAAALATSVAPSSPSTAFTTWDAFFSNSDAGCLISSCTISDSGSCGSGSFSGNADITFDSASPWGITAEKANADGYSHSVCI